jgi:hypothetical protein
MEQKHILKDFLQGSVEHYIPSHNHYLLHKDADVSSDLCFDNITVRIFLGYIYNKSVYTNIQTYPGWYAAKKYMYTQ